MRSFYEKVMAYALVRILFAIALGLMMLIFPASIVKIIVYIVAIFLILMGILKFITFFKTRNTSAGGTFDLLSAILLIALSVVLFVFTTQIASILPIFIGILLIIVGVYQLIEQFRISRLLGKTQIVQIILSILIIIGGVVGVFNPFGSLVFLFRVFGVIMLVAGINEFITWIVAKRANG